MEFKDVEYLSVKMKNGSNDDMNVDGSITPVLFKYDITGSEWYLDRITFFLYDPGIMSNTVLGSLLSGLTNGIEYGYSKDGSENIIDAIKTNTEMLMNFTTDIHSGQTVTGFLNEEDYFIGSIVFNQRIILRSDTPDYIFFRINDDLTSIGSIKARARIWRPL